MLKVIELFAGIGSQTQALKNIGVEHEVVAISEIDKYALQSYKALHGEVNNLGDIRQITELPEADLWTYSFPCQDISVAGKQSGIKEGTRSGLLFEVERLLAKARDSGTLPKYLLLENVKNLVGRQFRADYDKWLAFLSSLGYTTYWQILNAKHYGIPQNRERVFGLSILGEHEPYIFPEKQELKLKLRDMIDAEVDERYYLSEQALQSIMASSFTQHRDRLKNTDVCNTICARDHKDPQCVQVGTLTGEKWDKMHDISRRVYGSDGIAPTIHCAGGGNTEPKIIEDFYPGRPPRVYEETAPTLRSGRKGLKVVAGQFQPIDRDYNKNGTKREEQFECRKDELSNAVLTGDKKNCIKILAMRGRDTEDGSREQRPEVNDSGTTNALTTVQKDNLVLEQSDSFVGRGYQDFAEKNGYIPEMFNAYNRAEVKTIAPTVTTQCGSATSSASVLKADAKYILSSDAECGRTVRVGGRGDLGKHSWNVIKVAENTKQGYAEAEAGDGVNIQFPTSKTRRGRVGKGVSNTLTCGEGNAVVTENIRIRKLTPRECLRLMGWIDKQIDKIAVAGVSSTQQYKQAGNGIVVQVLEAVFTRLFLYA